MQEVNQMFEKNIRTESARFQLQEFNKFRRPCYKGEILCFEGVGEADVYNPSIPFEMNGETIIAARVEMRNTEKSSMVFFVKQEDVWLPKQGAPIFELQDPFIAWIGGELILGGVRVIWEDDRIGSWVTDFYRGYIT